MAKNPDLYHKMQSKKQPVKRSQKTLLKKLDKMLFG